MNLFEGATLALRSDDPFVVPLPLFFTSERTIRIWPRVGESYDELANDRPLQFGPFKQAGLVKEWALLDVEGQALDSGKLSRPRRVKRGDRIVLPRGAVKAAAVGDVLGITCVFMPSGFAVGVAPPAAAPGGFLGGTLGDFAYAGQDERTPARQFWLPKRRWAEMPRLLNEYGQWTKRLARPDVGVREVVLRREQQLVAAGVL